MDIENIAKEKRRLYQKEYRETHVRKPTPPEKQREYSLKYYSNPEKVEKRRVSHKAYRDSHKEYLAARAAEKVTCDQCEKELARGYLSKHVKIVHN